MTLCERWRLALPANGPLKSGRMSPDVPQPAGARIGVGISTVGRWAAARELLTDLARQTQRPNAVAIAHHDTVPPDGLDALLRDFGDAFPIRIVVSKRGVSNGRNAAAAVLDDVDWVWFPNDTNRIGPDFVERVSRHCVAPVTVCALQMVDAEGPRNKLPPPGAESTRRTVWGAIEPATVYNRAAFMSVGGFDPNLGSGSPSPWQSGEGPDLLLRLSEIGSLTVDWVGDIVVRSQTEFAQLPLEERRRKLRNYGRGAGNVLRTWHYPCWYKAAHLVAALLMPLRDPSKFTVRDALSLFIGRTEGVLGKLFSCDSDHQAILR